MCALHGHHHDHDHEHKKNEKATGQLRAEHEGIRLMIKILEKVSEDINNAKVEDLEKMVEFIKVFADKCHHAKEETLLFPALEAAGIPNEGGPIGVMLMEHDMGREFVAGMGEALEKMKAGDKEAGKEFAENALGYGNLLTSHIEKENNILFHMAEMSFSEEKDEELFLGFENIEKEKIGAGKHEEFHSLLDRLAAEYLK
ncbi:MAG: hemerythrin domain-containing protein [Patescibacteria group bacterium]